jgi:4a-hydroxytetrahydrobiopterin dehydratase
MKRPRALDQAAVRERLRARRARGAGADWRYVRGRLRLDLRFATFPDAIAFVRAAADAAEAEDHHPDIDIRYARVRLSLWTHDAPGITERDFRFIERLDRSGRFPRD